MDKLQYKIAICLITLLLIINLSVNYNGGYAAFAQEATDSVMEEQDEEQNENKQDEDEQDGEEQDEDDPDTDEPEEQTPEITVSTDPELDDGGDYVPIITEALKYMITADVPCDVILHIKKTTVGITTGGITVKAETEDMEVALTEDSLEQSLIFEEEGEYEIYVTFSDALGEEEESLKTHFKIDRSAPLLQISGIKNDAAYKEGKTVRFIVSDFTPNLEQCMVTVWKNGKKTDLPDFKWSQTDKDGYQYEGQLFLKEEGNYKITFEGEDSAGNQGKTVSVSFLIDQTAPVIKVECDMDYSVWLNQDITFHTMVSDDRAGIKQILYKVDGKAVKKVTFDQRIYEYDYELTISKSAAKVSGYPVIIEVTDNCGTKSILSRQVYIDKDAPQVTLSGVEKGVHYSKNQTITATVRDVSYIKTKTIFVVRRTLDGKTETISVPAFCPKQYEDTCNRKMDREGSYKIYALTTDSAGNVTKSNTLSFVIDKTAPKLSLSGPDNGSMNAMPVELEITCVESFFAANKVSIQVERELDGHTTTRELTGFPNTGKKSFLQQTVAEDGTYRITVSAADKAGNAAESQVLTFSIDRTRPEIRIRGTDNYEQWDKPATVQFTVVESFYKQNTVSISGTRRDMHGKVTDIQLPQLTSTGKTSTLSQTFEEDGIYEFLVVSKDQAGNTDSAEIHFTIDQTAPRIRHVKQFDRGYYQEFKLADTLEDFFEDLTVISYRILLNGIEYNATDTVTEEGKYNLYVVVKDELGHISSEMAEFIIDHTAPKVIFAGAKDGGMVHEKGAVTLSLTNTEDRITAVRMNGTDYGADVRSLPYEEYGFYRIEVDCVDKAGNTVTRSMNFVYNSPWTVVLLSGGMGLLIIVSCLCLWLRMRKKKREEGKV